MFIRQVKAIKLAEKDGVKKLQDTAGEIYYEKDRVYYEENPNTNPDSTQISIEIQIVEDLTTTAFI
jgi:L-ribulose-5-phosphate 3-epimerase UlaE